MSPRWRPPAPVLASAAVLAVLLGVVRWTAGPRPSLGAAEPTTPRPEEPRPDGGDAQAADTPPPRAMLRRWSGIDRLDQLLGPAVPTGAGVVVGHVEGSAGDYLPQRHAHEFRGVAMVACSGESKISSHAQATARIIYGSEGLAPGIALVNCLTTEDFMGPAFLRCGSSFPPARNAIRLYTHSWIARGDMAYGDLLHRVDHVIDEQEVVMVAGVDNGRESAVPAVLASAWNVIAVGNWNGDSSGSYTQVEEPGRCKPDIVAPGGRTSYASSVVCAVVARLLDGVVRQAPLRPEVAHAEVVKAVLLAGATKSQGWQPEPDRPLDRHLGAGGVDMARSYAILTAPPTRGADIRANYGWQFAALGADQTHTYHFSTLRPSAELSIVLVWHRRIEGRSRPDAGRRLIVWETTPIVADLDLALDRRDEHHAWRLAARSASSIDNVEHIHRTALEPGSYRIVVTRKDGRAQSWEYALAWRIEKQSGSSAR